MKEGTSRILVHLVCFFRLKFTLYLIMANSFLSKTIAFWLL